MKLNKIQNRRDFFKCSLKSGIKYLGSITGILFNEQKLITTIKDDCPDGILCRDCYKMGICEKEEAEKARIEVKRNGMTTKISKGDYNV